MLDTEWDTVLRQFAPVKRQLLINIAAGANYEEASKSVSKCEKTLYNYLNNDPAFAEAMMEAKERSIIIFENTLNACALKAEKDPRYQTSLIFLLKSRKRSVYGDHQTIINQKPQQIELVYSAEEAGKEQIETPKLAQEAA